MIALDIPALPKNPKGLRVDTGRSWRAKSHIDTPFLDHRRGRGIGIECVAELRLGIIEELQILDDLPALFIDAHGIEFLATLRGSRQPNLVSVDNRRRPP